MGATTSHMRAIYGRKWNCIVYKYMCVRVYFRLQFNLNILHSHIASPICSCVKFVFSLPFSVFGSLKFASGFGPPPRSLDPLLQYLKYEDH